MANRGFFPPFDLKRKVWMKHLFISKQEEKDHVKITNFIQRQLAGRNCTKIVPVPGSKTGQTYDIPEEICRLCTKELVMFVVFAYISGWSFRGDITMDDLFMTPTGSLRICLSKWDALVRADKVGTQLDTKAASRLIRTDIFQGCALPRDIDHLVRLLDNFNGNYKLLLYHPGLKHEVGKLAQYEILYMRLLQLQKINSPKFSRIIAQVPYCDIGSDHWKFRVEGNNYLQKVLMYKGGNNARVRTSKRKAVPALNPQSQGMPQGWVNVNGLLISPALVQQARRTIAADLPLLQKVDPGLRPYVWPPGLQPPQPLQGPQADADRKAFYQLLLDYIGSNYDDSGSGLCRDARNSQVHVFMDDSVDPGTPAAAAPQPAAPQPAAPQPAAPQPAAPIAPSVRIDYCQVEHMYGCAMPGFYCEIFEAMANEDEADTPEDESLTLMMASIV